VPSALATGLWSRVSARVAHIRLPRRPLTFLVSFVGTKALAFLGLLWIARSVSATIYGSIELSLAVGTIAGSVGLIGIHGAAPRLALAMGDEKIDDLLAFATFLLSATAAVGAAAIWVLGLPPLWACLAGCSATAAAQASLAAYARTRALPIMNSLVDASAAISMVLAVAALQLAREVTIAHVAQVFTFLAASIAAASFAVFRWRVRENFRSGYLNALSMGWRMQVFGLTSVIFGAGLRPLLALTLPLSALGVYSLCFRVANLLLLIHQVVSTYIFAVLYRSGSRGFDLLFALLVGFLAVLSVGLWIAVPLMVHKVFPTYLSDLALIEKVFPLIEAQVVLWIGEALLENRTNRFGLSTRAAGGGLCAIVAYALFFRFGGLAGAILLFDAVLAAFALFQVWLLWRADDRLPMAAGSILAVLLAACARCVL